MQLSLAKRTTHPVVIAQLFRLSSSRFTLPSDWSGLPANLTNTTISIQPSDVPQVLASLQAASERQDRILQVLLEAQDDERKRYDRLGKPVGAVFLAISVLYILGGEYY